MMNDYLAQHYTSTVGSSDLSQLKVPSDEKSVVAYLNKTVGKWAFDITGVYQTQNGMAVTVVAYFPHTILSGMGNSYQNALCNIIRDITYNVASDSKPISKDNNVVDDVLKQMEQKKEKALNNQSSLQQPSNIYPEKKEEEVFGSNMFQNIPKVNEPNTSTAPPVPQANKPTEVNFFSKEAEEIEKEFSKMVFEEPQKEKFVPTPENINPTGQIFPPNAWSTEQGQKAKNWMAEFGINKKEEFSAWLIRYCGLDYDHFNPQYIDNFIEWVNEMREKQTY